LLAHPPFEYYGVVTFREAQCITSRPTRTHKCVRALARTPCSCAGCLHVRPHQMSSFSQRAAGDVGIEPVCIAGSEAHGLVYFLGEENPHVGAQCADCHTVVWVVARNNPVLMSTRPSGVPESGSGYTAWYKTKLCEFLGSLPPCPVCGATGYDRFINNVQFPRFSDGTEFVPTQATRIISVKAQQVKVWVHEDSV
jgi:hypothetical protein